MKRQRIIVWMCIVAGLAGTLVPFMAYGTEETDSGRIYGTVQNGTTGGPVAGLELILRALGAEQVTEQQQTLSDSDGNFVFSDLDASEGSHYGLYAVYKEVDYYSPALVFENQTREISSDMMVYEPTDSDQHISTVMHHLVIGIENGDMWIREMMILENSEDTIYVGAQEVKDGRKVTLRVSLPSGASGLQIGEGLTDYYTLGTEDGFVDTRAIPPGKKRVEFLYTIDSGRSTIDLAKTVHLNTGSFDVFIPNTGLQAESQDLEYVGLIGEPDAQFQHFSAKQVDHGAQLALTLRHPSGKKRPFNLFAAVGVLLLGLGFLYPLIRHWTTPTHTGQTAHSQDGRIDLTELREDRQRQLQAIAELDARLESGQISSKDHRVKRQTLKHHVVELTKTLQQHNKEVAP